MLNRRMGSLRIKGKKQRIYARFYYLDVQREEPLNYYCVGSGVSDCKCRDHKAAFAILAEIERKIDAGLFEYKEFFPKSNALKGLGQSVIDKSVTFGAYAAAWLEQQQLAYSTEKTYKSAIYYKLMPFFGSIPIKDILPFHVRQFIKTMDCSPKYVRNIIGTLSAIFSSAMLDSLLERNPCALIKTPKIETEQVDALSYNEAELIISYIKKHHPKMALFFGIGFYMGLRTGEIMGLQWGDFDFVTNKLTIQRTITNGKLKKGTKTADKRSIDIPPILDIFIAAHKPYTFIKSDWLFLSYQNEPYKSYNTITDYYWKPALKFHGIRYRQMYQMRHSFASNALQDGFPVAWVQQMLGHSTPAMLLKRYGNYIYKADGRQGFGVINSQNKLQNKG